MGASEAGAKTVNDEGVDPCTSMDVRNDIPAPAPKKVFDQMMDTRKAGTAKKHFNDTKTTTGSPVDGDSYVTVVKRRRSSRSPVSSRRRSRGWSSRLAELQPH